MIRWMFLTLTKILEVILTETVDDRPHTDAWHGASLGITIRTDNVSEWCTVEVNHWSRRLILLSSIIKHARGGENMDGTLPGQNGNSSHRHRSRHCNCCSWRSAI